MVDYFLEAKIELAANNCQKAEVAVRKAIAVERKTSYLYQFLGLIYEDCFKDATKAAEFYLAAEELQKAEETPIEKL